MNQESIAKNRVGAKSHTSISSTDTGEHAHSIVLAGPRPGGPLHQQHRATRSQPCVGRTSSRRPSPSAAPTTGVRRCDYARESNPSGPKCCRAHQYLRGHIIPPGVSMISHHTLFEKSAFFCVLVTWEWECPLRCMMDR